MDEIVSFSLCSMGGLVTMARVCHGGGYMEGMACFLVAVGVPRLFVRTLVFPCLSSSIPPWRAIVGDSTAPFLFKAVQGLRILEFL